MLTTIITLLIIFQLKHFLADYVLQTKYMLGKSKDEGWELPLLSHVAVHAAFTFLIAIHYTDIVRSVSLAIMDGFVHFVMDRAKASPKMLGRFKLSTSIDPTPEELRSTKYYFCSYGLDQMVHHLTGYVIIWLILGQ